MQASKVQGYLFAFMYLLAAHYSNCFYIYVSHSTLGVLFIYSDVFRAKEASLKAKKQTILLLRGYK